MRTTQSLEKSFQIEFEKIISDFGVKQGVLPDISALKSPRFLRRSIVPHVKKLSHLFNRIEKKQESALEPYWRESSNPEHLRLSYFLYFMPPHLFRVASVWNELTRAGFKWEHQDLRAIEFGSGPASGACGIAAGEYYEGTKLPKFTSWALIEQDPIFLKLGAAWARTYFDYLEKKQWSIRTFHRQIKENQPFLPPRAPAFHLWIMSFYLNELDLSPSYLAEKLVKSWDQHLENEGIVFLIEPALKLQSRKLLALREELLILKKKKNIEWLQILLPCLGHQNCGAWMNGEDWCHEDVTWWRPSYIKTIDTMAGLDRKTLPFSYLVLTKSLRKQEEILPHLKRKHGQLLHRLVSPAHHEGKQLEFFLCSQNGKQRVRCHCEKIKDPCLSRGDILIGSKIKNNGTILQIHEIEKKI
jgi:hypothetical protein